VIWDDDKVLASDFETSGTEPEYALQPWRIPQGEAWATSLVWVKKEGRKFQDYGGLFPSKRVLRENLEMALDEKRRMLCWNALFDISVYMAHGLDKLVKQCKWIDGMLVWRHVFIEPEYEMTKGQKKSYSLKLAVAEFMPEHAGYEDEIDYHSTDPEDLKKLHDYNIRDNIYTHMITRHLWRILQEFPDRLRAMLIEADCLPMVAEANLHGILIDRLVASDLRQRLWNDARRGLEALSDHGVTEEVVRSPTKLAALIYDDWGLPILKENKGKKTGLISRSTDKEVLHELAFKDPRAKTLREYREALNNRTKFAEAPLKASVYNGDGCARPQAIVFGTYSGRLTYSSNQRAREINPKTGKERYTTLQTGWALHQEKQGADFRGIATAPPGYDLVEFDAAGQEYRWMAICSGDETMLSMCLPGEDPHSFMGARIAQIGYREMMRLRKEGDEKTKAIMEGRRKMGKVGNLSLQYRTSAKKLRVVARVQYNMDMELPEAQYIWKTYQDTYTGVPKYWKQQIALTKSCGYVETLAGRRVQVIGNWDGSMGWSMGSTAINYRIQGTGADQKYLALSVLRPYMIEHGIKFAWDLHDGIYFWVPQEKTYQAAADMQWLLNNLPYQKAWGIEPPIPLPWDCKIGPSWGTLKEWKGE